MTRVALLGATGSIGRQALEVIEANADLELVAATSIPCGPPWTQASVMVSITSRLPAPQRRAAITS